MKNLFLTSSFHQVGDTFLRFVPASAHAKVAFVPTAADVYDTRPWMEADRQKLIGLGFYVEEYDIKDKTEQSICADLAEKDVIFVSGGNTFYLLYHVRRSGFDKAIRRLLDGGKRYVGSSAGSILVGPTIEPTRSLDNAEQAPKLTSFNGLGFVDFVMLPHYGMKKYEERYRIILKEWSSIVSLLPITDEQAVVVEGSKYHIV